MDNCKHYFILPPPNGNSSIGVCKLCGEIREMFNYQEQSANPWVHNNKEGNPNREGTP